MTKLYSTVFALFFFAGEGIAQYSRHIIELKDKKGTSFSLADPTPYLSAKSIQRRTKYKIGIDSTDLPVSAAYVDSISAIPNVTILNVSKWLNQVCIRTTDAAALSKINNFSFVKRTAPIASVNRATQRPLDKKPLGILIKTKKKKKFSEQTANLLNYGSSLSQVQLHAGEYLHNLGFTGQGMTIAVLDAGFRGYKTNPVFDSVRLQNRILGEWDFVANEESVNEDNDHGAYVFSILAANRPGFIIGTAPHAKYYLYRTEDVASEYPVEEQNWVAAAERADSLGVDMISSSLGYLDFDDPSFNYSYAQRDGNTSIITKAADLAAKKGILVMNSAGNSGTSPNDLKYIACPADGDSVMAVGAVDINGNMAAFSSWGPNGAGKVKPNIVSVGLGTAFADINGNPQNGNGTSFSNPNIAGLIACLWQAYPEFSNMEIFDVIQRSCNRYDNPDTRFGYGIPNLKDAAILLEQKKVRNNYEALLANNWIKAYPIPFKELLSVVFKAPASGKVSLRLINVNGSTLQVQSFEVVEGSTYSTTFSDLGLLRNSVYFVQYHDGKNHQLLKVIK